MKNNSLIFKIVLKSFLIILLIWDIATILLLIVLPSIEGVRIWHYIAVFVFGSLCWGISYGIAEYLEHEVKKGR